MPPIPAFLVVPNVGFDVLPQGIHDADVASIEARLVDAFNPSQQRRTVFDGWRVFDTLLGKLLPINAEYLDGSFVTAKPNPKDVDVSYWVDADVLNALTPVDAATLNTLWSSRATFHVDGYIVPECHPQHPQRAFFDGMLWTEHYWSRCRDAQGVLLPPHEARKGYLRVTP